jgi:hypothetical protein
MSLTNIDASIVVYYLGRRSVYVRIDAFNAGFYVIEQTGDTVKIDIPKDFTPREW